MERPIDFSEWRLDQTIPDSERAALVRISWAYPDIEPLLHLTLADRIAAIDLDHQQKCEQLIATGMFADYKVNGRKQRPTGIETRTPLSQLYEVAKLDLVKDISFLEIDHAVKKRKRPMARFYCVKMTVVIIVEGQRSGMQTIEDRFVLVKVASHEEAYQKLESRKADYEQPYLNTDGELVRWVIESYDDCYETDAFSAKDFNDLDKAEVYSKLRSRRYKR